jgi:hypothetical protein
VIDNQFRSKRFINEGLLYIYMINQSKVNDPRMWKRWRASGAVGTIEDVTGSSWKKNLGGEVSRTSELFIPCSVSRRAKI